LHLIFTKTGSVCTSLGQSMSKAINYRNMRFCLWVGMLEGTVNGTASISLITTTTTTRYTHI